MVLGGLDHLAHALGAADVAGIDAQAGGARLGRLDGALVVEMDVGDDRHLRRPCTIVAQRRGRFLVGAGDADDVGAGLLAAADLRDGRRRRRWSACWSWSGRDRRVAADRHGADHDLPRLAAHDVAIGPDAHARQCSRSDGGLSSRRGQPAGDTALARVDDAVGDAGRHDVAFAGPHIGLRQNVAVGRAQFDPAVGAHADRRVDAYRKARGGRVGGRACAPRLPRPAAGGAAAAWRRAAVRPAPAAGRPAPGRSGRERSSRPAAAAARERRRRPAVRAARPAASAGVGGATLSRRAGQTSARQACRARCALPGRRRRRGGRGRRAAGAGGGRRRSTATAPDVRPAGDPAPAEPSRRRPTARAANSARRRSPRRRPAGRSARQGRSARASRRSGSRPAG